MSIRSADIHRSDEELAGHARAGSLASFGELVERYTPRLVAFLTRRCGSPDAAEDLAQESFLRAWRAISSYDPERRFSTWLYTIASRLACDHLRKAASERRALADRRLSARESGGTQPGERPSCVAVWEAAHRTLNPVALSALWLRYVAGLDISDIARVIGRSNTATRVILFRAREKLSTAMPGGPEDDGAIVDAKESPMARAVAGGVP